MDGRVETKCLLNHILVQREAVKVLVLQGSQTAVRTRAWQVGQLLLVELFDDRRFGGQAQHDPGADRG